MGFSLERFFEELKELLAVDINPEDKLARMEVLVIESEKYAKECGATS